ncbi:MAG: Gldg family protein [Gammaproteobacteria bacterium]|nr:Gldg family protein [Gammaproteobacteria bacterium]
MFGRILLGGGLLIAVVLLLAVNIFAGNAFSGWRLDLTDHKLFTLSEGTKKTLSGLEEPVTLRLYLSQKLATRLPAVSSYAARVRELLEEYEHAADGKLIISVIDPEPFSEQEDRAVGYGLSGIPLQDGESTFYFGLVGTNALDAQETIPYLSIERGEFLEYDITKLIHTLGNPKRPVIGMLSTLNLDGVDPRARARGGPPQGGEPWVIMNQLNELFDVRRLATRGDSIPEEIGVLLIIHPFGLGEQMLYAIDQFVLRGGRVLAFVDPFPEADTGGQPTMPGMPPQPRASDLGALLASWGVALDTQQAVGDLQLAAQVRTQSPAGDRTVQVEYPVWMNVPTQLLNPNDIVTGQVGNLTFASPGELTKLDGVDTTFTPLVRTTTAATKFDLEMLGPLADVEELLRNYTPGGKQLTLGARITAPAGAIKSAYPDGRPAKPEPDKPAEGEADAAPEHMAASTKEAHIVVIGDTDLLQDQFWVQVQNFLGQRMAQPIAGNGNLVINALENLMGSSDLISVRSRGGFLRPFTRVNELRQDAELQFREKEVELIERLKQTEQRIAEMDQAQGGTGQSLALSPAQRKEVAKFRDERVRIRTELRGVRHALRKNIEKLETWVKFSNIALVPILIAIGGFFVSIHRMRKRRRSVHLAKQPA